MDATVKGKILTANVYETKNKENNEIIEKRLNNLSFLVPDRRTSGVLDGKIIFPYVSTDSYIGPYDFSDFKRFEEVILDMDVSNFKGEEVYKLFNIRKI